MLYSQMVEYGKNSRLTRYARGGTERDGPTCQSRRAAATRLVARPSQAESVGPLARQATQPPTRSGTITKGFRGMIDPVASLDPDVGQEPRYFSEETEPDWYKTNIPCQVGCPAHTDRANYIGRISEGRLGEAYVLHRRSHVRRA